MFIKPDYIVDSLDDIDFEELKQEQDIKTLIFDLDSTVMPSKAGKFLPETEKLLARLKMMFRVVIISNNNDDNYIEQVKAVCPVEIIGRAGKPNPRKMVDFLATFGGKPEETVVIGDRPLTDILAGIFLGAKTILTDSITKDTEAPIVRKVRKWERFFVTEPKSVFIRKAKIVPPVQQ